eukprot:TRINITY_DN7142_c0_g1_i1.p1 TRINITY_DN7142_c0_g1~~TRINITY_DN7142_c0_g1_i1.p1  ORF type:complete len:390 (-),score=141.23 TRINITY_DN7142_c0_g1_i1:197-1366(-)
MANTNASVVAYLKNQGVDAGLVSQLKEALKVTDDGLTSTIDLAAAVKEFSGSSAAASPSLSAPAASELSPEMEQKFAGYIELISSRGYFKTFAKGSDEYNALHVKARSRFVKKFAGSATATLSDEEKSRQGDAHKVKGNEYYRGQQYAEALSSYTDAINCNPDNAVYYSNRALVLQRLNRSQDAIVDCEKAISLDPKFLRGYLRLADSYANLNRFDEAIAQIDLVIGMDDSQQYKNKREELVAKQQQFAAGGAAAPGAMPGMPAGMPNIPGMPSMEALANMPGFDQMMGAANGQMPDMATMFSNPEFMEMAKNMVQNNPELMKVAENMMSNPAALSAMMNSFPGMPNVNPEELSNMMQQGGMPGGMPGAGVPPLAEDDTTPPPPAQNED